MKAALYNKYGKADNIFIDNISKPVVTEGKVLVKILAASINQADAYILQGKPFPLRLMTGLFKPKNKTLGSDISGVVVEVGTKVKEFNVGDEVFGQLILQDIGGYSEYALVVPKQISKKPKGVSYSEAAAVPMAGLTALQGLRLGEVQEGSKVLIYGASGGVGTFFVQLAKAMNAHVTAVCSTRNIFVAQEAGADVIINYKEEKWTERNEKYDVIFGVNGYNKITEYRDALKENGIFVSVGGEMKQLFEVMLRVPFMRKKMNRSFKNYVAKVSTKDLDILGKYLEDGSLRPFVDKEFPLSQTKDAFKHFMSGKTIGKTIIKISE